MRAIVCGRLGDYAGPGRRASSAHASEEYRTADLTKAEIADQLRTVFSLGVAHAVRTPDHQAPGARGVNRRLKPESPAALQGPDVVEVIVDGSDDRRDARRAPLPRGICGLGRGALPSSDRRAERGARHGPGPSLATIPDLREQLAPREHYAHKDARCRREILVIVPTRHHGSTTGVTTGDLTMLDAPPLRECS
jgi:hypothetical protein